MRHFIITRFLCCDFGYGDKIKSPEFINEGIRFLKTYFIPSLLNQTNHNFEIIFAIHNEIPFQRVRALDAIGTGDIKAHIVRWKDIKDFIYKSSSSQDVVITTRMDYDDLVFRDAVSVVQNLATSVTNVDYMWHAYSTGCTLIEGDKNCEVYEMCKKYNNDGAWSTFQSLVSFKKKKMTIYDLGDHTKIKETVKSGTTQLKYREGCFVCDDRDLAYVWVRHDNTGSHSCSHVTKKQLKIDRDEFWRRFGIPLTTT